VVSERNRASIRACANGVFDAVGQFDLATHGARERFSLQQYWSLYGRDIGCADAGTRKGRPSSMNRLVFERFAAR